jgi:hypothetical protein
VINETAGIRDDAVDAAPTAAERMVRQRLGIRQRVGDQAAEIAGQPTNRPTGIAQPKIFGGVLNERSETRNRVVEQCAATRLGIVYGAVDDRSGVRDGVRDESAETFPDQAAARIVLTAGAASGSAAIAGVIATGTGFAASAAATAVIAAAGILATVIARGSALAGLAAAARGIITASRRSALIATA